MDRFVGEELARGSRGSSKMAGSREGVTTRVVAEFDGAFREDGSNVFVDPLSDCSVVSLGC